MLLLHVILQQLDNQSVKAFPLAFCILLVFVPLSFRYSHLYFVKLCMIFSYCLFTCCRLHFLTPFSLYHNLIYVSPYKLYKYVPIYLCILSIEMCAHIWYTIYSEREQQHLIRREQQGTLQQTDKCESFRNCRTASFCDFQCESHYTTISKCH